MMKQPQPTIIARTDQSVLLEMLLHEEIIWFQGHYPGHPILPGVIQLQWALHFGRHFLGTPIHCRVVDMIKFRKPLTVGNRIRLQLDWDSGARRLPFVYHLHEDGQWVEASVGKLRFPA